MWEFTGMKTNPLIAQRRTAVVVQFLWVWIAFPVTQLSNILKMLHAAQRVAKKALRIWGSRCLTAKIAGETTVGLTVTTRKTIFYGKILTWLSRPRSSSMMKNRMAHRVGRGIMDTALG